MIQTLPGVAGVQVVVAARGGDPVPVAFVQPREDSVVHEGVLRAQCSARLAKFKVPERIVILDRFPIADGPNGPKVQRVKLREMAERLLCEQPRTSAAEIAVPRS